MTTAHRTAGYKLVESGSLVNFDIVDTKIDESAGGDEAIVRIDLHLGEQEDDDDRTEDHEWGGPPSADYIRGRCVKTDITVRPDGTATLETRCRGEAATRWVARLKGKKMLEEVG